MKTASVLAMGALFVLSSACSNSPTNNQTGPVDAGTPVDAGPGDAGAAPPFVDTTGQASARPSYPSGPYGVGVGSVVQNIALAGFPAPQRGTATLQRLRLSDFYNPHGKDPSYSPDGGDDRYFPADSPYSRAGQLKPTVLSVDVSAVWCGPCNKEASDVLPGLYARYKGCGGEFMTVLEDSATPNVPATQTNLTDWIQAYSIDYPTALDPESSMQILFQSFSFPQNFVIDTTTMKMVNVFAGETNYGVCGTTANGYPCNQNSECGACTDTATYEACDGGTCLCPDSQTTCQSTAQCATVACTESDYWKSFDALLDRSRAGCTF
jgi:hypothetical protein